MAWAKRILTAAAVLTLAACAGAEKPGAMAPLTAQRTTMAQALAAQAAFCFQRQDTDNPVFHGCVDWHSAAHGAWALAEYQRDTGDARYAAILDAAFDPAKLRLEVEHLRRERSFERPYGRAWFLRLATTWRTLHPDDHRLDELAEEAATSLLRYYQDTPPNPLREEYANPSWAFVNLLAYARARHDTELEQQAVQVIRMNMLGPHCDLALEARGFLAVCTTWAWLMSEALPQGEFRAWYAQWNPGLETLTPVTTFNNAHDYGRNFSRAWGLWPLANKLEDERLRASYAAHVQAGFEPRNQWSGEYMVNGHWVAQFGMLAIEPLFGPPPR